ncbi:hypothetical protein [Butyrivibrio sp. WCE2006]|uniref:hypothetical protein n=1 Tax=Butyrivibrio sp. WCE2006 TaxID=1410611 RepID=UPI0005D28E7D|nr:hypothetical protein [Butyrivibrio sp. WCE2006]
MKHFLNEKAILKKLNNHGASMVVALVVFIVCSFVALAIVNSAILNAQRTMAEKREEIAYAATTKAMDLIRECIEDDATYRYEEGVSIADPTDTQEQKVKGFDNKLGTTVKAMAESVASGGAATDRTITFVSDGVEDKLKGTVKGKIAMASDYTITIDVYIKGSNGSSLANYPLTLIIPGSSQIVNEDKLGTKTNTGSYDSKEITYISWSKKGMYVISKKRDA